MKVRQVTEDDDKRRELLKVQAELCNWVVFMPLDCRCSCGFDFTTWERSWSEPITGCPECDMTYC